MMDGLNSTIPYYKHIKRGLRTTRQTKQKSRKKPQTLTEMSQSGKKPVMKHNVSIGQVVRKLYDYEMTGLSPRQINDMVARNESLEARIRKLE